MISRTEIGRGGKCPRCRLVFMLAAVLAVQAAARAGESGPRVMSGWFYATTPDGWTGRRYMDGDEIFAEEFDSSGDRRIDVWRFYRRGRLTSEERDLNGDGRVNCVSRWDPHNSRLLSFSRDARSRGINDLEIEAAGDRRWEIREDRNRDGVTDRVLFIQGPNDLFEQLGMDLAIQEDVIDAIPSEYWRELWSDDGFTSVITDYRRYNRGQISQYGELRNGRVRWRRVGPDFIPPAAPAREEPDAAARPAAPEVAAAPEPHYAEPPGEPYRPPEPVSSPGEEQFGEPARPAFSDRTRYDSLPPGDSAARSLPAPMRPPGVGRR